MKSLGRNMSLVSQRLSDRLFECVQILIIRFRQLPQELRVGTSRKEYIRILRR